MKHLQSILKFSVALLWSVQKYIIYGSGSICIQRVLWHVMTLLGDELMVMGWLRCHVSPLKWRKRKKMLGLTSRQWEMIKGALNYSFASHWSGVDIMDVHFLLIIHERCWTFWSLAQHPPHHIEYVRRHQPDVLAQYFIGKILQFSAISTWHTVDIHLNAQMVCF